MSDNQGGGAHMGKKNQEGVPTGVRTREERRLCDASCGKGVLTADKSLERLDEPWKGVKYT